MNSFIRIVVLALVLCPSRTPLPWGHSHSGMDAEELVSHLDKYHPATSKSDLPKGWHWHVSQVDVNTDGQTKPIPVAVVERSSGTSLVVPTPDRTSAVYPTELFRPEGPDWTCISPAHACYQQQTYLRLNVLLI
jgi:hypothetical protein